MKQIMMSAMIAAILLSSCSSDEEADEIIPLVADFEVTINGEAPNAQIMLQNNSTGANTYSWSFSQGASIESSTDETPTGVIVDKSGDLSITLTAGDGTNETQITKIVNIGGNSAINTYEDIEFAQNAGDPTIARFFSTSTGQSILDEEVNETNGPSIDLAFKGHESTFIFFESPDNLFDNSFQIPGATTTKIVNYESGFSIEDFDLMTDDQLLTGLAIEHDESAIGTLDFPVTVLFENSQGKKGVIKLKQVNSSSLLVDVKVQKY